MICKGVQMAFCTRRVSEHRERGAEMQRREKKRDAVHAKAAEHKIEAIARAAASCSFQRSANRV